MTKNEKLIKLQSIANLNIAIYCETLEDDRKF